MARKNQSSCIDEIKRRSTEVVDVSIIRKLKLASRKKQNILLQSVLRRKSQQMTITSNEAHLILLKGGQARKRFKTRRLRK
jgi:hypothetical protein